MLKHINNKLNAIITQLFIARSCKATKQSQIIALVIIFSITLISSVQAADSVDYANYYDVQVKEESKPAAESNPNATPTVEAPKSITDEALSGVKVSPTEKSIEFTVSKELEKSNHSNEISVKNEYPESVKVVFEAIGEEIEIYLNAYEVQEKVSLSKNSDYKIRVYNVYNEYLGYIRSASTITGKVNISPFLLVRDLTVEAPTVKFVREEKQAPTTTPAPIINPAPAVENKASNENETTNTPSIVADVLDYVDLKDEFAKHKQIPSPVEKRSIRVANISNSKIHISIIDNGGTQTIGDGWTVPNDIYEPQYLNLQSQPILISAEADITINKATGEAIKKKAKELNIDEKGNYVWLIDNLVSK